MSTGGQVEAVPESGEFTRGESTSAERAVMTAAAVWTETRAPQEICAAYGSDFVPPAPLDRVAVALNTLGQPPLNARRVSPERGACGWYIWGGEGGSRSGNPGFFQTLQVAHLLERCPQVMPFLALAPGWRVQLAANGPEIKPPHDVAPPDNVAVRRISARASPPPSVKQWVWLSILLHILAIVLLGDTTGGGARSNERPGGPLNVTLQGSAERVADERLALRVDTRLGSLERRENAPPVAASTPPTVTAKDKAPAEIVSPSAPTAAEATPVMPRVIAKEVDTPVTTFVVPLAPPEAVTPPELPAARLPESLPRLDALVTPKAIVPPKIERDVALPTELIPRLAPLVPPRTERETTLPAEAPPRLKTFVAPRVEPEALVPPIEIPRLVPLTAAQIEREIVRPAELLPRLPPPTPAAAIDTVTPTAEVPRLAPPVPPAAPAATDRVAEPVRTPPPPSAVSTAAPTPVLPGPSRVAPGVSGGTGTGDDILAPRGAMAPPSATAPGSAPRIDLDSVRQRAREIAREGMGARTLLPFDVKGKEAIKRKEQQAFDKALKRPDCRDAYAGMGLAAVVPLLWDAVSEKGCKW